MRYQQNSRAPLVFWLAAVLLLTGSFAIRSSGNAAARNNAATQTAEKIFVSLSNDTIAWNDDTLYTLNPDGSGQTEIFNMHNQPKITTGEMWGLRVSGGDVYFHSEHAYIYTPARRNVFRLALLNNNLDQITPGPNSGVWGQTGNSVVSGVAQYGNGSPCSNCPVYLEGMDSVNTDAGGGFSFQNVPAGARWLTAYRSDLSAFDSQSITVVSGVNVTGLTLVPNSAARMNFEYPAVYGSRIYYRYNTEIQWTDVNFAPPVTVYTTPADACAGIPTVDAFDAGAVTGKIAIYDYQEGCGAGNTNHNGIYVTDKDGGGKQLFLDMLADSNWNDPTLPVEVRWSPNENYLAVKASYNWYDYLLVYDASGVLKGWAVADTTTEVLTLHGWSPDGNWLLYSTYNGNRAQASLGKVKVNADGSLDNASITTLLSNQPISSAAWGRAAVAQKVYLPLIIR